MITDIFSPLLWGVIVSLFALGLLVVGCGGSQQGSQQGSQEEGSQKEGAPPCRAALWGRSRT